MRQIIDIEEIVDGQRIDRFNLRLLFWSFLAMFADGYDIGAIGFAAPELIRQWHLAPGDFKWALTASLFGILFGAPALGWFGDRYGRKTAIILGSVIYGLATLAVVLATAPGDIVVLRFLTGIGVGGLMPNTISLTSESSPRRLRATLIILMFTGITLGSSSPGWISAWLMPTYGWQILFWIGGIGPLVLAACLWFALPESIKFLSHRPDRRVQLLRTARALRRDLLIPDDADFRAAPTAPDAARVTQIFAGDLRWITPLLWVCFGTALMANYFIGSWLPLLFENSGMPPGEAAITSSLYHVGGAVGGIVISVLLDRFGFAVIAVLFAAAGPLIALIGFDSLPHGVMIGVVCIAGFAVLGAQFGNNASAGLLYQTAVRSKGVGAALAIGRFGSIIGPLVGGMLIDMQLPMRQLFAAAAAPMVLGLIASVLLARLSYRRFGGLRIDDRPMRRGT